MNIVITGASRGIGKALAEKFATEKHNLILSSQSGHALYQALEGLQLRHPDVIIKAKPADLSDRTEVQAFATWAIREAERMEGGTIDVLINNAGKYTPGRVYDEAEGVLEDTLNLNLLSAYHLTRAILPGMIAQKKGHIFNICSIASIQAYPNGGSYSISKFALLGFTKNLREEMKKLGIKVTAVIPGAVYTDSWKESDLPPERFIEVNDIANIIYQCSQLSPSATVEDIVIRPQLGDI